MLFDLNRSIGKWNVYTALQQAKNGAEIINDQATMRIGYKEERVLISTAQYTLRLSEQDFIELYNKEYFVPYKSKEEINDKKDEAYYAWRAVHQ